MMRGRSGEEAYYPFGMMMPNTDNVSMGGHSFGFNGMEQDEEMKGKGNHYTSPFRQYDPRVGRWFSIDPKAIAAWSPYNAMDGNPISFRDPLGDSIRVPKNLFDPSKAGEKGYNDEGLNMKDWRTFKQGIKEVTGITLKTPSRGDKNLEVESIDYSMGSEDARKHFNLILSHCDKHQDVEITNNDPDIDGAELTAMDKWDKQGKYLGTIYNAGVMEVDLADFRKWKNTNSGKKGTTDDRAIGVGFSIIHENLHNWGYGMQGVTKNTLSTWDEETPVINMVNNMRQQMGLPGRDGHSTKTDGFGPHQKFDDGTKYYIK